MNDKLIKLLGLDLDPKASDADVQAAILAAVRALVDSASANRAALDQEAVLNDMIRRSHGGLTRKSALEVLANRKAYADQQAALKKAAKKK